ncbi:hypothetical protein FF38_09156 [Lucilia cuprina]|uniref:Uncharacterized protein n=1 Tax=Lucilia cuprina TaxID=7375 RepID=A0A0L0CR68_LUCCU|nr:uncharacterized protein LOC111677079 [Lucilia cuprina]KAI8126070.1 hypothetical protein CVS40_3648 [Lucilia cuprina]KNC34712.1 hypothetical protein FF38_09156 [Lucilia cuprina]
MNNGGFGYNPAGYVKNFNCLRNWCFWAGGFGLVQSLIWIGLTLTGILSYSCIISIGGTFNYGSLFRVVFLELYFMGTCADTIPPYNNEMLREVKTVLNPQDIVIWDSVYLAVAVCWLLASVLLMTYLKQDQPRVVSGILWTWVLVTFCICSMDLALGVIFGIDYGRFNRKAYDYNLSSVNAGVINPDAAQLLAGMVASMSMLILSFKGFILWIVNVCFMIYLAIRALWIGHDNNGANNLFMPRKESDDILATRPPINAYQEEEQKPSVLSTVFANEGFEPDNNTVENVNVINRDIIARAARLSTDVQLHERRFRNLDNFQQYPPRSRPESMMPVQEQTQQPNSPIVVAAFPAPDYTPPMQRAAQNPNRNQRYQ